MAQTFEMESPQDPPMRVAAHPTQRVLALGFESGAVRVLAVEGPAVWMEANHHKNPITGIWFVDVTSCAEEFSNGCIHLSPLQHQEQMQNVPALNASENRNHVCCLVISLDSSGCEQQTSTNCHVVMQYQSFSNAWVERI